MKSSDEVILSITGDGFTNSITGWTDVRISRGIERMPNDFEISMSEIFPGVDQIIAREGMACTIDIGEDRIISGWIDQVINSIGPEEHPIRIVGRGYCQDLVDCSAVWQGGQFLNQTVLKIAQSLAKPFGINVICENPGAAFPVVRMTPGESPFAIISRLCMIRGLLCYEDENGDLNLSGVGSDGAAGGIQEGVNVEHASLTLAMNQRFSDYTVLQQGAAFLFDATGNQSLAVYTAKDTLVPRFRPKYITVENGDANEQVAIHRAQTEANRRLGRGHALTVGIDSWRDLDGDLWYPNTIVQLDIPTLKISKQSWLIGEIDYTYGIQGKHCEMTIMPPGAFDVLPVLNQPIPADMVHAFSTK